MSAFLSDKVGHSARKLIGPAAWLAVFAFIVAATYMPGNAAVNSAYYTESRPYLAEKYGYTQSIGIRWMLSAEPIVATIGEVVGKYADYSYGKVTYALSNFYNWINIVDPIVSALKAFGDSVDNKMREWDPIKHYDRFP